MAEKRTLDTAEKFLSKVQSATIQILGSRYSTKPCKAFVDQQELNDTVGWMQVNGYFREERNRVVHAFHEYRQVASAALPIPVERTPEIEPFFLP